MGRAPCCDKANVKRGPWSPEEDAALRSYLEKHGTGGNWIALPQKAGLRRCGKSCRLRWLNYLRPDIKHGCFTEEEDDIICTLYKNIGSRWSVIASHLSGRTDNDVKNYWNTKLKKKLVGGFFDTKVGGVLMMNPPPPPTPPMLLSLPPILPTAVKTETYSAPDFDSGGFGSINNPEACWFLSELPPFPMPSPLLTEQAPKTTEFPTGFVEDGSSATSSSVENWAPPPPPPVNSDGSGHDLFLSELGFGSYSEFLNGFGEIAPFKYQSVTYS